MKRLDLLQARLVHAAEAALNNPTFGLPGWAQQVARERLQAQPVICCGSGMWAQALLRYRGDLNVVAVVDDAHAGKHVLGLPCLDTADFVHFAQRNAGTVCVNTGWSDAGYAHFERAGEAAGLQMLNFQQAVRAFGLTTDIRIGDWRGYIAQHIDDFLSIGDLLADTLSVETLYSVLLFHLDTDREHLLRINRPGEATYFRSGLFELNEHETYVDVGAFDGDSVAQFLRASQRRFESVHAFEPDPANFACLQRWFGSEARFPYATRIELHPQAVTSVGGTIEIVPTGTAGACVVETSGKNAATCHVEAVALDEAVTEPITLLKADVEGHELDVLRGARGHLNADHPKLAICAYHLPSDLIELPRFIEGLNAGYRLGVRHHSSTRYDTVLYAF